MSEGNQNLNGSNINNGLDPLSRMKSQTQDSQTKNNETSQKKNFNDDLANEILDVLKNPKDTRTLEFNKNLNPSSSNDVNKRTLNFAHAQNNAPIKVVNFAPTEKQEPTHKQAKYETRGSVFVKIGDEINIENDYYQVDNPVLILAKEEKQKLNRDKLKSFGLSYNEIVQNEEPLDNLEAIIQVNKEQIKGKLVLTNFKFIFIGKSQNFYEGLLIRKSYFSFNYPLIQKIDKKLDKKNSHLGYLDITSKDYRNIKLSFRNINELEKVYSIMQSKTQIENLYDLQAFQACQYLYQIEQKQNKWNNFCIKREFERQGLKIQNSNETDRITEMKYLDNSFGRICSTYPQILVIPSRAMDSVIFQASKFRSKDRLPVLSYAYKGKLLSRISYLFRSSQCMPGIQQIRSYEDEALLRIIGDPSDNKQSQITLHIYDARPYLNAMANKMNGKGFENVAHYKNAELQFLGIQNIHNVRDSYKKMMNLFLSTETNNKWFQQIDQTNWFEFLNQFIQSSVNIAQSLKKGFNCLVHCSDGWDRTSQLVSLSQILLDPYFRTFEGFQILIEKEWIDFGHQFQLRGGHIRNSKNDEDQQSPIFIQFLDAVHQIMHQYPLSFQFNQKLLTQLAYHYYSCQFGDFLCDSKLDKIKFKIPDNTVSIWSYFAENQEKFLNPFYQTCNEIDHTEIFPKSDYKFLRVWKEHFSYYSVGSQDQYKIHLEADFTDQNMDILYAYSKQKCTMQQEMINELNKQISQLKMQLNPEKFTNELLDHEQITTRSRSCDINEKDAEINSTDNQKNLDLKQEIQSQTSSEDSREHEIIQSEEINQEFEMKLQKNTSLNVENNENQNQLNSNIETEQGYKQNNE